MGVFYFISIKVQLLLLPPLLLVCVKAARLCRNQSQLDWVLIGHPNKNL